MKLGKYCHKFPGGHVSIKREMHEWLAKGGNEPLKKYGVTSTTRGSVNGIDENDAKSTFDFWMLDGMVDLGWQRGDVGCCGVTEHREDNRWFMCVKKVGHETHDGSSNGNGGRAQQFRQLSGGGKGMFR
jgi:hypothetical protein